MTERGSDISKYHLQNIKSHSSMVSLSLEQNSNSLSPSSTSIETSSTNYLALTRTGEATTSISGLQEFPVKCCCDGRLHQWESGNVARQPFCGWEQRTLPCTGSTHFIFTQHSDQSVGSNGNLHRDTNRSVNGTFTKSKCSFYQSTNQKRTDFRSHVRSYMHTSDSRTILYEFEHHKGGDISLYIDKYRKSITYPKMEQKSIPFTSGMAASAGEPLSLWSGSKYIPSSVLKPKLFVLGEGSTVSHTRPLTCRKNCVHGAGFFSLPESKPKFRLSDLNSTAQQQQQQELSSSSEDRSRTEAKQYPIPVITGFSSLQNEPTLSQSSEIEFVGAEEDSDAQLSSMTWVSQSVPESYLISTVMYPSPSNTHPSIPKQKAVSSTLSKNPSAVSSTGFRGSMNANPLRSFNSLNRGATLLAMANKKSQTFSRNGTTKKLTYGFQLSSHSIPLITSSEKTSTKTNKLGHLLKRKHRTDTAGIRSTPCGEADNIISAHGSY